MAWRVAAFSVVLLAFSPFHARATLCEPTVVTENLPPHESAFATPTSLPLDTYGFNAPDLSYCIGLSPPFNLADYSYCFGLLGGSSESGPASHINSQTAAGNTKARKEFATSDLTRPHQGGTWRLAADGTGTAAFSNKSRGGDSWIAECFPMGPMSEEEAIIAVQWGSGGKWLHPPAESAVENEKNRPKEHSVPVHEPATLVLLASGASVLRIVRYLGKRH